MSTTLVQRDPDADDGSAARPRSWSIVGMVATIVALNLLGWSLLAGASAGGQGGASLGFGVGLTAYVLGLRHAFDADHIAAIDNTTRKLVGDGAKPVSVGFWFSLGHSTVVLALTLGLAIGAKALIGPVENQDSTLHQVTGVIGTGVSSLFLYVIAAINLGLLVSRLRTLRRVRSGDVAETDADSWTVTGPLTRVLGRVMRSIRRPGHMYPLGVLFGFGFDTATEVGLLVLAATGAASGLPWYSLVSLPILFAAGMSMLDTADGLVMHYAYGWAFANPGRRLTYNLTITAFSVGVAFLVGTLEILGLLGDQFHLVGAVGSWAARLDLNAMGFYIVGAFIALWLAAWALRKGGGRLLARRGVMLMLRGRQRIPEGCPAGDAQFREDTIEMP